MRGTCFPIIFEGKEVIPPYDDPLVIMVKIAHYGVYRTLVDSSSFFNLLYLSLLLDMKIDPKEITQQ